MPLQVIMTAAKTVSRASDWVFSPPVIISVTISADLDDGDRDREHQRAERLADPVGDDLGVVHRGEHRAGQEAAPRRPRPAREAPGPSTAARSTTASSD